MSLALRLAMGGHLVRTIGLQRAKIKIGLMKNLALAGSKPLPSITAIASSK